MIECMFEESWNTDGSKVKYLKKIHKKKYHVMPDSITGYTEVFTLEDGNLVLERCGNGEGCFAVRILYETGVDMKRFEELMDKHEAYLKSVKADFKVIE